MKRKPGASGSRRGAVPRKASKRVSPGNRPKAGPKGRTGRKAKASGGFLSLSPLELAKRLVAQKERAKLARQKEKAVAVRNKFRQRKSDAGKFVMVGIDGKRNPQDKGRKGYLVYVTKTGKKQLAGYKQDFKPRKISDIEAPAHGNKLKAAKEFQAARRVKVSGGRAAVKARGSVATGGANDFNETVVSKLAKGVRAGMMRQASRRTFILSVNVLVELPSGETRVYSVQVPIARADHIAIELGGIENFIRQKFYAFMARELQFDGYVTRGSANHIRRLKDNQGKPVSQWVQGDGNKWRGNESEIVQIKQLEWQLEQAK